MDIPDLNLLVPLDVLITEGSVVRAADRLRLSPSAMSRTLARLRYLTGDPLLVRAGRGLVPTPRALELRARVSQLVQEGAAVLRPAERLDLATLARSFTIRTREGFVENFGAELLARVAREAAGVRLAFVLKPNRDSTALRGGDVDLELGVVSDSTSPEVRAQSLFHDRHVGVVRNGHPLARATVSRARYTAARHVSIARPGRERGRIDAALAAFGVEREISAIVSGFTAALALARGSDLVATVPERHTGKLREGMHTFPLPLELPELTVSLLWHPRLDADPAHRWLRECVRDVCGTRPQRNRGARRPK